MSLAPFRDYPLADDSLAHRALLAFCAISRRLSALIERAREGPPLRPPCLEASCFFEADRPPLMASRTTRNALTFKSTSHLLWS